MVAVTPESRISMRVVRGLLDGVEQSGVARTQFLRAAQLPPERLAADDARMTRAEVYRLCELAISLTADPAFGLHWCERLTGTTFNVVSDLIAHSATLRQALESVQQFHRLLSDRYSFELIERSDKVTIRVAPVSGESSKIERFIAEMQMTGFFRLIRSFSADARPDRVSFEYAAPDYRGEYARVFEGTERFQQPFTEILFDRALMNAASPYKDEDLHNAIRSIAERRVLRLTQRTPFSVRVRELLAQQAPSTRADMQTVARQLGLSVRSLRRRLSAEGKTYSAVANEALAIVAQQLLRDTQRTIQETAYEMGFSDTSAFHRAFKHWTGTTPRAFRETQLGRE
jgi:AraC-like DNA-binding protein